MSASSCFLSLSPNVNKWINQSCMFSWLFLLVIYITWYRSTIDTFRQSLFLDGEHLRGEIVLSFFDQKEHSQYFGLVIRHENIYFERWKIPIVVTDQSFTDLIPDSEESKSLYQSAYDQLHAAIISIMDVSFNSIFYKISINVCIFRRWTVPPIIFRGQTMTSRYMLFHLLLQWGKSPVVITISFQRIYNINLHQILKVHQMILQW